MTTAIEQLNSGQRLIYSYSNIRRAFTDFDDTDISGMHFNDDDLVVVYNDGAEKLFDKRPIKETFKDFRSRCPTSFLILDLI